MILNKNISAEVVKSLSLEEKKQLCNELRSLIVHTVESNGGHLASNLGAVEIIVALHSVFETPLDKIVFDVGHQSYAHKILTGRAKNFNTLRCEDGISGFPKTSESEHDAFIAGHSSISISAALGLAESMKLSGDDHSVVAVIGDGAFTGGEAYEGINNAGKTDCNLVVVLNDNQMSISKNTGAIARYLSEMRSSSKYYHTKKRVEQVLTRTPVIGKGIAGAMKGTKKLLKNVIYSGNLFEDLGITYLGPLDGHNLEDLIDAFTVAKLLHKPCLIHVCTKKGKGYAPAEENSGEYHGLAPKNAITPDGECFTEVFGNKLEQLGAVDERICAVTAAMKYATGLHYFAKSYPERFFDVGIAEPHAVSFCAGLAADGKIPVFAVYSSFLQRSFDQLIHDCSIEKRHVVLCIDRAGLVGEDGETHHGLFDIPMISSAPDSVIYSPSDTTELCFCLEKAILSDTGLTAVRYPRGCELYTSSAESYYDYKYTDNGKDKLIFTYGRITAYATTLTEYADVLQAVKIFPILPEIVDICFKYNELYLFEECQENGGICEKLATMLLKRGYKGKVKITALHGFAPQASATRQLELAGLNAEGMKKALLSE